MFLSLILCLRSRVTCLLWWSQCFLTISGPWQLLLLRSKAFSSHQACPTSQVHMHTNNMHTEKLPRIGHTLENAKKVCFLEHSCHSNKSSTLLTVFGNWKRSSESHCFSLLWTTNTSIGIPVHVNEVCQVRNVLDMNAEIYKPSLFTSGTIHWTQRGLECLFYSVLKACQLQNTSATWNFTLSHTHTFTHTHKFSSMLSWYSVTQHCELDKLHVRPKTHTTKRRKCMIPRGLCTNRDNKTLEHTYKHTSSTQSSYCRILGTTCFLSLSSSFAHSFLPCIPPGACLTPRSTDPPYFIHNNCAHWLSWDCKERQEWRKGLKSHYCTLTFDFGVFFNKRLDMESLLGTNSRGYTRCSYEFISISQQGSTGLELCSPWSQAPMCADNKRY